MITVGSLFDGINIIYVAGPITGMPDNNRKAFRAAEAYLTNQGLTVLSPEAIQPRHKPERISHGQYMEICLAMIKAVQAVYFLAGWELSKGAKMEHDWARALGKRIIYEDAKIETMDEVKRAIIA